MKNNFVENLSLFCGAILFTVIVCVVIALPTMWLWNWLMPTIFGLIKINFWQALGINLISALLIKGGAKTYKNE